MSLIAVDVGTGTQDILIYEERGEIENAVKLVLPTPTKVFAGRVRRAAKTGRPVSLTGYTMGGGPLGRAVQLVIAGGTEVYATRAAALTLHDNLEKVAEMGVRVDEEPPEDAVELVLGDWMGAELAAALEPFGVEVPKKRLIAVQDHGFSPVMSNRKFRFLQMTEMLDAGGWDVYSLVHDPPTPDMTRMHAVREQAGPKTMVMDTGPAALLGALEDPRVAEAAERGVTLVNAGNGHTLAFTIRGERICGVFEHHTGALTPEKLEAYLRRLQDGTLTGEEVYADDGHGAVVHEPLDSSLLVVTGPNRAKLLPDAYVAVPHGDMMLSGCFGLIRAWEHGKELNK